MKNEMRTVDIPVGSPMPAQDDNQQSAITSSSIASFQQLRSPERAPPAFFKVRGRLPQSFLSPQSKSLTRFTLVTLLVLAFRLAMSMPTTLTTFVVPTGKSNPRENKAFLIRVVRD